MTTGRRDDLDGDDVRRDRGGSSDYLDRVEVSTNGFNYVGTVVRDYVEQGERVVLVEDTTGQQRIARPDRPGTTIDYLDRDGGGGGS